MALPLDVYAVVVLVVDVVGFSLHLDLFSCVVCKACWVEWLHNRHGRCGVTMTQLWTKYISASVTACRIFLFIVFPAPFPSPSSLLPWSWWVAFFGLWLCFLRQDGQPFRYFMKKKCLLASVRGYCMLHGWSSRWDVVLEFLLFHFIIPRVLLGSSLYVWCVMRLMHDGAFSGAVFWNETAARSVVSFLMLQKKKKKKADCLISHMRDGWKTMYCLHTHLHPPLLKKNTRSHGSAFCCDIFFNLSAWARISVANGLRDQICHAFAICSGSAFMFSLLCMVSNVLHSSLSVCVGVLKNKYGGRRENEVKRMQ